MTKEAIVRVSQGEKTSGISSADEAKKEKQRRVPKESFPPPPLFDAVCTYISYGLVIIFGHIADFMRRLGLRSDAKLVFYRDVRKVHKRVFAASYI